LTDAYDPVGCGHADSRVVAVSTYDVFLDESGHTGDQFSDRTQPTYALAGWVVRTAAAADADQLVVA